MPSLSFKFKFCVPTMLCLEQNGMISVGIRTKTLKSQIHWERDVWFWWSHGTCYFESSSRYSQFSYSLHKSQIHWERDGWFWWSHGTCYFEPSSRYSQFSYSLFSSLLLALNFPSVNKFCLLLLFCHLSYPLLLLPFRPLFTYFSQNVLWMPFEST
jgi:hypothetical protein